MPTAAARPTTTEAVPADTAGLMISIWSRKALKLGFLHPVRLKIKIIIIIIE